MTTESAEQLTRLPRYFQIKLALSERIAEAEPGTSLPPERQLAAELGTSRTTLRKAIAELTAEGVLRPTQGSGNYVSPPRLVHVRQLTSLTHDLGAEGKTVTSRLLSAERIRADAELAGHLEIAIGSRVHQLTRLRIVDDEPMAIETAHLPGRLPGLVERVVANGSLYATLRDDYGIEIDAVEDSIETALATPVEADLLEIPSGAPLLLVHRQARNSAGVVVEWTRSAYRGDRFRFVARS
ncbi:GntR family transcriptional regulator [Gordonia sp. TBRC 11910]|uniref:GntR family transcriptional regulator n=1 Tax=Gordonia asplenii TaxID=2725283 RepID=A0A848KZS8_9ACTN|nr:GntR family transcriptional regulator [Gordonia asplenii]NMO04086.1 GntR family transcriptional regulator [Gordonia asplenii]